MFACFSFILSVAVAVFNAVVAIRTSSFWYGALAVVYAILAITRSSLIFHHFRSYGMADETEEHRHLRQIKTYRACGIVIIFLAFVLGAAALETSLGQDVFVNTPGMTIYLIAVYTFYKIIMSALHLFRVQRDDDMTIHAVRNVNFADALVSVLALQTAILHEFAPEVNLWQMYAFTGALVCVVTIVIGVLMTVVSVRKGKKIKAERAGTQDAAAE